ncbi:MAG: histidine phosphatase family protein [Clostridia bacterium]|nr:histidine phosphatase family protein [Clostridia bacterium]
MANQEKSFGGQHDYPLTELGRTQAEKCAEALKNESAYKIDRIYASDLKRAYDTAVPISRALGLDIIPTSRLREIFAGKWEGMPFVEIDKEYGEDYRIWRTDIGRARCTGGESVKELSERVLAALADIASENEGKTVCIATHATPIRAVCAAAAKIESADMAKIPWVANASINVFDYEDGRFVPIDVDNYRHLGDLATKLPSNV